MAKEKRLQTKQLQFRVTPKEYDIFAEYAEKNKMTKVQLLRKILKQFECDK